MPDLTANGSSTPAVIFDPTAGNDWRIIRDSADKLNVQVNLSGTWQNILMLDADGVSRVRAPSGELIIANSSSNPKLKAGSHDSAIQLKASEVEIQGNKLYAPNGVATANTTPIRWRTFTGTLGSTSPKSVDLGYNNKVVGALVMIEDPNTTGIFGSMPMDMPSGSMGLNNYYTVQRNPSGGGNDKVGITFQTGVWASTKQYKIVAWYDV